MYTLAVLSLGWQCVHMMVACCIHWLSVRPDPYENASEMINLTPLSLNLTPLSVDLTPFQTVIIHMVLGVAFYR